MGGSQYLAVASPLFAASCALWGSVRKGFLRLANVGFWPVAHGPLALTQFSKKQVIISGGWEFDPKADENLSGHKMAAAPGASASAAVIRVLNLCVPTEPLVELNRILPARHPGYSDRAHWTAPQVP